MSCGAMHDGERSCETQTVHDEYDMVCIDCFL
jgi:hypothetical protein